MARTFGDMQVELMERLNVTDGRDAVRIRRWLNDAAHELDGEERWDYLFASVAGAMPLTIADLDKVESVADLNADYALLGVDRLSLVRDVGDLTLTGTPVYYYKTAPTVLAVYPVSTTSLTVKYIKFAPDMTLAADTPLVSDRWRQAIVELACAKGFRYGGDYNAAQACTDAYGRILQQMRTSMLNPPTFMARTVYALDD